MALRLRTVTGTVNGAAIGSTTNLSTTTFKQNDVVTIGGKTFKFDGTTIKSDTAFKKAITDAGFTLGSKGNATMKGKALTLQIGDTSASYNQLKVSINDCHTAALQIDKLDIGNQKGAADALDQIKSAINYVSDVRGTLGATQNRLDHTINNLSVMEENIQDAESTIRDTDVADEMMAYEEQHPDRVRPGHAGPGEPGAPGRPAAAAVIQSSCSFIAITAIATT